MAEDADTSRKLSEPEEVLNDAENGSSSAAVHENDGADAPSSQNDTTPHDDSADRDSDPETATPPVVFAVSPLRLGAAIGLVFVIALAGLVGWLGYRSYESRQADQQRELFLRVARQGALNLTTIDWRHADADVQRILNSATGPFYDDFSKRSQPFIDVVKQAQSVSVGTIAEAGLESASDNQAQALVAVSVKTSNAGAAEQTPRGWRMRISVEKVGTETKVSGVSFVP